MHAISSALDRHVRANDEHAPIKHVESIEHVNDEHAFLHDEITRTCTGHAVMKGPDGAPESSDVSVHLGSKPRDSQRRASSTRLVHSGVQGVATLPPPPFTLSRKKIAKCAQPQKS